MRLKNKVAIVTGGAGGIGVSTCEKFVNEGAKLVIADIAVDDVKNLSDRLNSLGHDTRNICVDISKFEEAERLFNFAIDNFGCVDVLVNIAGGSGGVFLKTRHSLFVDSTEERWKEVIDLNLYGTMNCVKAVINHMVERKTGKIINFSSIAGIIGMQKAAEYSAAKAGITGFTKTLAKEVGKFGINVNCISPGVIGTNRIKRLNKDYVEPWKNVIPLCRFGEPDEIALAVVFLASDDSNYITGSTIKVDGGMDLGTGF